MTVQYGLALRTARLARFREMVDPDLSGILPIICRVYRGAIPADLTVAAPGGDILAEFNLPDPAWVDNGNGSMSKSGIWADPAINITGAATFFRLFQNTLALVQGTVGTSGSDMIVDTTAFVAGQSFSVITFNLTDPNT